MPEGYRHLTYAERCQIHALMKSGLSGGAIARQLGRDRTTVWRRWDRFLAEGAGGPRRDATRPPGKAPVPEDRVKAVVALAMPPPPEHARHPGACHSRQRPAAQGGRGPRVAEGPSRPDVPPHAHIGPVDGRRPGGSSRSCPGRG